MSARHAGALTIGSAGTGARRRVSPLSFLAGAALGPLVGGAVLEFFWWGSAFLLGVQVMVLLLVAGPFLLPEYRDPQAGRLDLLSALLALAAVLTTIYDSSPKFLGRYSR